MPCKKCGKFTFFRDLCRACEKSGSGSRVFTSLSGRKRIKWQWQAKILKVNINGAERTLDANAGLGENMIQELAREMGMPLTELQDLLHHGHASQLADINVSRSIEGESGLPEIAAPNQPARARKRITMIDCPQCHHRIPEAEWCLYCGQQLAEATHAQEPVNEVDRAFLEKDVKVESKAEATLEQHLRDGFGDRLKHL